MPHGEEKHQEEQQEQQGGGFGVDVAADPGSDDEDSGGTPDPIGVPSMVRNEEGEFEPFVATLPGRREQPRGERGGLVAGAGNIPEREQEPRYFEGDHQNPARFGINANSFASVTRMQADLVRAGLLDPENISAGNWDGDTANAMKDVLGVANRTGVPWDQALTRLIAAGENLAEDEDMASILKEEVEPFTPPSYEELAQTARETVEGSLGRDLKDYEVEIMADKLKGYHREAHSNHTAIAKARQDAAMEAQEEGGAENVDPGTVQGVKDPALAFRAFAREHFQEEMDRDEDVQETAQNRNLSLRIFKSLGEV